MKDVLGLQDMEPKDIELILDEAREMKKVILSGNKRAPMLAGKTVVTLFYENSTRTRLSFELASKYMGANAANVAARGSSIEKGETLIDTAATIEAMGADAVAIRHPMSGAAAFVAQRVSASVVNAGDGMHEHPTQALLDMFTMREAKGGIAGLCVAIVGDVLHSRVARSNVWGLSKMGARVRVAAPPTLLPAGVFDGFAEAFFDAREAVRGADVVMALRLQLERQKSGLFPSVREYSRLCGIGRGLAALAKPDALFMHPGPANRGVEIMSEVADGPGSAIADQVTNGVAVRMAVLDILVNRGKKT